METNNAFSAYPLYFSWTQLYITPEIDSYPSTSNQVVVFLSQNILLITSKVCNEKYLFDNYIKAYYKLY